TTPLYTHPTMLFNTPATTEIYTLSLHDALPICPEGDEKWFLENEKTVTQFCRKLAAERPLKDIRDEYNYPKKKGIKDECSAASLDRKSGSAGMPRPISYAVFCLKKKNSHMRRDNGDPDDDPA